MPAPDHRRRAAWAVVVGATAVALSGCVGSSNSGSHTAPGSAPISAPAIVGAGDAADAVAGRDYDVVATLRGADAEQATVLARDGVVLLVRYADHDYARTRCSTRAPVPVRRWSRLPARPPSTR